MKLFILFFVIMNVSIFGQQESKTGIKHSFMTSGQRTMEVDEKDQVIWEYKGGSKEASKLASGNYLIAYKDNVVEVTPDKKIVWEYKRTVNSEIMSTQRLENGMTLVTEQGNSPRLVEVDKNGEVKLVIPINPETKNSHMQSRMSRKLPNGNYLVPHRLMPFVKEYDKDGKEIKVFRLDIEELGGTKAKNGSFRADRFDDGSTLITCASGNRMVLFDSTGKVKWHLTSEDLGGILKDVCGLQVLKNGNYLVSCYGNSGKDEYKLMEITTDKKVVWTYKNSSIRNIHTVQVLTTNGDKE